LQIIYSVSIRSRLTIINYLGLVLPIVTAGIIALVYDQSWIQEWAKHAWTFIGGLLALAQLAVSLWALSSKWEEKLAASKEHMNEFIELLARLESLDPNDESELKELESRTWDGARADGLVGVSQKEKDRGRKAAILRYP
jgi:mobilome CxxCx(11)CxxC protein